MERLIEEIIRVGELLFREGLVDAVAGNLSVRFRNSIFITRRGRITGNLKRADVLRLNLLKDFLDPRASSELIAHRSIYLNTEARAVVHAHPTYAVILSYRNGLIEPIDSEGREILGRVKVLSLRKPSASKELAQALSSELKKERIVLVKGHGAFAVGNSLKEAYRYVSCLERSCKILSFQGRR